MLKGASCKDHDSKNRRKNGVNKVLNAPVHLGAMAATHEAQVEQIKSIWVTTRDDGMVNIEKHIFFSVRHRSVRSFIFLLILFFFN